MSDPKTCPVCGGKVAHDALKSLDTRAPVEHELKTWRIYFNAIADGTKTFEIRRDDRGFRVGDMLRLRETEYGSGKYTGREERRRITHILRGEEDLGLRDGYAILSLARPAIAKAKVTP